MTGVDTPPPPALARAGIDRAAAEREEPGLIARLTADPGTHVVAVSVDRALAAASGDRLARVPAAAVPPDAIRAFLGRDADGAAVLLAVIDAEEEAALAPAVPGAQWAALRVVGGDLDPVEAGLMVEAVALGRWHVDAPFCSACGTRTDVRSGGWARQCPACGRDHFPRTDPAVIVAVASADGERLLLGRNALWAGRNMYSTFAGFVEAGESLEATIVREVAEEAGVTIVASSYRGSQAWPYPRSLMLGFHARAEEGAVAAPDGVEIVDARWFSRDELRTALRDADAVEFTLPGTASIARLLIEDWAAMRR